MADATSESGLVFWTQPTSENYKQIRVRDVVVVCFVLFWGGGAIFVFLLLDRSLSVVKHNHWSKRELLSTLELSIENHTKDLTTSYMYLHSRTHELADIIIRWQVIAAIRFSYSCAHSSKEDIWADTNWCCTASCFLDLRTNLLCKLSWCFTLW